MTGVAAALMVMSAAAPLVGALVGLIIIACNAQWRRAAALSASIGLLVSFVSSACLIAALTGELSGPDGLHTASYKLGTWLDLTGLRRLHVDWGLQADQSAAIWIAVLSGLAWLTVVLSNQEADDDSATAFAITTALVLAATIGFVLSSGIVQMLTCWTALSLTTLLMAGWSSRAGASVQGMRRAVQAGLPGDILLLWPALWMAQAGGLTSFADISSTEGLARLGAGNPALPGVIGCLLVLGVLGRCGLFPCFGWHHEASAWDARVCIVVYGIGFVPSAVWLLLKCYPLLATFDVPLTLLGGLGTLGAVVGAFVACGQDDRHRRLAYLLAAQTGVLLAGLGSGLNASVGACVIHQCSVSVAAFVLFAGSRHGSAAANHSRAAAWCAALSLAGLIPFSGGWSQQGLIELNMHPVSWTSTSTAESHSPAVNTESAAAQPRVSDSLDILPDQSVPHWGWICGLWLAQGLSAYAAIRAIGPDAARATDSTRSPVSLSPPRAADWLVNSAAVFLLIGGPCGWLLGLVSFPNSPDALLRIAIGQSAAIAGLLAGWQAERAAKSANGLARPTNRWEFLARLSRQRLYVDDVVRQILTGPRALAQLVSGWLGPSVVDRCWTGMIVRNAAWLGTQVETLHVERADFYVATIILGTVTLLLTLVLVA